MRGVRSIHQGSRGVTRKTGVQRYENRLVQVFLAGAAVTSVALNVYGDVDPKWYLPGVFMALYATYRKLDDIPDMKPGVETTVYRNSAEYYIGLQQRVQRAKESVWMTYMRASPPPGSGSPEAEAYFNYTLQWAKGHPDREFRRIFAAAETGPMADWLIGHHQQVRDVENYRPRVLLNALKIDSLSAGIFDTSEVVLVLTMDGNRLTGHTFDRAETVGNFRDWYQAMWYAAEPLEAFVRRVQERPRTTT